MTSPNPKPLPMTPERLEFWRERLNGKDPVAGKSSIASFLATISHWQSRAVEAERERDEARRRCMDILDAVEQGTFPHERR